MRINLTIIISILLVVGLVALSFTLFQVYQERQRLQIDLERRSALISESLQEGVLAQLELGKKARLQQMADKFAKGQRLMGVAVYDLKDSLLALTPGLKPLIDISGIYRLQAVNVDSSFNFYHRYGQNDIHYNVSPLRQEDLVMGSLVVVNDANYIHHRINGIWKTNFIRWFVQALVVAFVTLLVIRWSILNPMNKMVDWMKGLRSGKYDGRQTRPTADLFAPLQTEVNQMAKQMLEAKASAEEEAKLRTLGEAIWTPERLKEEMKNLLENRPLIAVSNREPYMHVRKGNEIVAIVPASGLVTAMEPILKACGGTWIASGSGDADREMVDQNNKVGVPPDEPKYSLKRVWLSKEEEEGYYYGFANEGLWPLCHNAHTRPTFREEDWKYYQEVNQKFAEAVLEEIAGQDAPLIMIQDYHFALLPRLIKNRRPDARVAIFWHIPWPNPESFGICPWQRELLTGMLGADLIGFHTRFHCNNFLETVDRTMECRISYEHFTVSVGGHTSMVKPFPISIAFTLKDLEQKANDSPSIQELLKAHGLKAEFMGVGVDRIDYTKGIVERFLAVEKFLETYPEYQGKFTFVELGAPSRTHIKKYSDLLNEVEKEAERINWRFKSKDWKAILFLEKHHSHAEILPYYRAANLCMVTSLHDGMNLVAKEFISTRNNLTGALILSRFTGAARELRDALIINPYDIKQTSGAIKYALEMPLEEQQKRMTGMRQILVRHNIYLWAANLIRELSSVRL